MKHYTRSVAGKLIMFILCILSGCVFLISLIAAVAMNDAGVTYKQEKEVFDETVVRVIAQRIYNISGKSGWNYYFTEKNFSKSAPLTASSSGTNVMFVVEDSKGNVCVASEEFTDDETGHQTMDAYADIDFDYTVYYVRGKLNNGFTYYDVYSVYDSEEIDSVQIYPVHVRLRTGLPVVDAVSLTYFIVRAAYTLQYGIVAIIGLSLVLTFVLFVLLMTAAGRWPEDNEIHSTFADRIPFEFVILFDAVITGTLFMLLNVSETNAGQIFFLVLFVIAFASLGLMTLMNIAVRAKDKRFIKSTLLYIIAKYIWQFVMLCYRMIVKIPFIWKTCLILAVTAIIELMVISDADKSTIAGMWALKEILLIPLRMYFAVCFKRILQSIEKIKGGDFGYHTDTTAMVLEMKHRGDALNSISDGMAVAVREATKSEKMKAELITNVSHDIKTPLTSIINYSLLMDKEETDTAKIKEYSKVIVKKSVQLKRLLEDLVEVSRASTGNLEVDLSECDTAMFIEQSAGEYEDKLRASQLTLVTSTPEERIPIMADSRRMWRIFDNLMNNICKYSMPGTRVYMDLEKKSDDSGKDFAVVTMRNTSRRQLNITEDELMERFVRGDSSRNSEGSGLGLSIAKNLAELQGGTLKILIDGDLFKAILTFPAIESKIKAEDEQ